MKLRLTPIAMAITLLSLSVTTMAQTTDDKAVSTVKPANPPEKAIIKEGEVAKVEVKGSAQDYDPRRDDTASKTILRSEEIMKYGDTNVYDVLKRAPGVTVIGNSIRMRGLGNGYTQILVNGERPPPGFSMDSLPPDQIEKIEVIRAATAEHSMQAIAGSINIVLKKVVAKAQRDLRMHVGKAGDANNVMFLGTLADRKGNLSYYLNAMVARSRDRHENFGTDQFTVPDGQIVQLRDKFGKQNNSSTNMGIQPRLNWKLNNDDQLNLNAYLQNGRHDSGYDAQNNNLVGQFGRPDYVRYESQMESRSRFFGGEVNWITKLVGGKLDAKLTFSKGKSTTDSISLASTADRLVGLRRTNDSESNFRNASSTAKYSKTLFEGHSLATGWEISRQKMEQDDARLEGIVGVPPEPTLEVFAPEVTKLAAYIQDEWNITKNWSWYQGVRWEGIRTESAGTGLLTTQSRNHVLSPVAQTLYKFPDKSGRQLRMALTRTYKAPTTEQLSARRSESDLNTRFNPDHSGNPMLRPELANGIDLTYEHFFAPGAVFSVAASARSIKDYIRSRLTQDSRGYWLIQPLNDGEAQVRTLDVELKFPLKAIMKGAPAFDFRANVNRNWSKVDTVPGPDNRLDQQIPLSVVLGADYRVDKFNTGASFAFRKGGAVRISEQQFAHLQLRRELEAYVLYKFKPSLQLRVSVNNALGVDNRGYSRYTDANGTNESWTNSPRSPRIQANVEMKF